MRRLSTFVLGVALLGLAGGCQGEKPSAPGETSGASSDDYFPMVTDARWVYQVQASLGRFEVEVTARKVMDLPGAEEAVFVMDERNLGRSLGFAVVAPVGYVKRDGYVARVSGIDYVGSDPASGELLLLGRYEPTFMFPEDPLPGQTWEQQTDMFGNKEHPGALMGWSGTVRELTRVRVPAGTFEDVLEIETHYRDASEGSLEPKAIYHDYYARGVGLIRSVVEDPSGDPANRVEQVLLEYAIP